MNDIYDMIIIGGGPAGLACNIYASRAGYKTLLIERIGFGGQMIIANYIDNYPGYPEGISGIKLQEKLVAQARKFNLNEIFENVVKIEKDGTNFKVHTENGIYTGISVVVASGAKHRNLDVKGENEFSSRGVSYCATCDAPFFRDKNIIVVGGGDTALSEAPFLAKFAKSVKIVHRRDRFRAVKSLVDQTSRLKNVEYVFNSVLTEIKGDRSVKSVFIKNLISNEEHEEPIDGIFILVGIIPNTEFLDKNLLDSEGYIVTDIRLETKTRGIFAAGDVKSGAFRQIICAVSDGATSAEYSGKYIDEIKGNAYL